MTRLGTDNVVETVHPMIIELAIGGTATNQAIEMALGGAATDQGRMRVTHAWSSLTTLDVFYQRNLTIN